MADTTDLAVDLANAIHERIEVFCQGHELPLVMVAGVLEMVKAEIMAESLTVPSTNIDYDA